MELPKSHGKDFAKKIYKSKYCQHEGCNREFIGHPVSRYCNIHNTIEFRDIRHLKQIHLKRKMDKDAQVENNIVIKGLENGTTIDFTCGLDGCNRKYRRKTGKAQDFNTFPRFCSKHRNEFQRKMFKKEMVCQNH